MGDKSHCSVCGKAKEKRFINYANIEVYIECECERKCREEKEKADCEYARRTAVELRNKNSRLSLLGQKATFDRMNVDKYNEVAVRGGKYLLNQLLKNEEGVGKNSLVLQGNRGSGKTYIACAVINDFNSQNPVSDLRIRQILKERDSSYRKEEFSAVKSPCKFITEMDLFALYYENYNYCKTEGPLDEFKKAGKLLVVDDVGASNYEKKRVQAMYLNIIDYRYSQGLPLMLTTNLTKSELSDYLGDRSFDRLKACSYFVDLTSPESRRAG
ncbi:MAG: hypothetical protein J6D06_10210 [Clostridia bacterium]|nr:hypothetical protein [Clostridia bacterium]